MDNKKYRILMYSPAFIPATNPEAIVNGNLVLRLLEAGHEVEIITHRRQALESYLWQEPWKSLQPHIHMIDYPENRGILDKLYCFWQCLRSGFFIGGTKLWTQELRKGLELHQQKPFDLIMARALPLSAALPAIKFTKQHPIPLLFNINDPVYAIPPYPQLTPLRRFGSKFFLHAAIKKSFCTTFTTVRLRNHTAESLNCDIPNWRAIPHILSSVSDEKNQVPKHFVIVHAGTLGIERSPHTFFSAYEKFLDKFPDAKTNCIFAGKVHKKYRLKVENNPVLKGKITFCDAMPFTQCRELLKNSAVQLLIEAPGEFSPYLPTKFLDYLQNRRPILAVSPVEGELRDYSAKGFCEHADCRNADAIFDSLVRLYTNWQNGENECYRFNEANQYFYNEPMKIYDELFAEATASVAETQA